MNQLFVGAVSSGVPVGLIVTLVIIAALAIAIAVAVYKKNTESDRFQEICSVRILLYRESIIRKGK